MLKSLIKIIRVCIVCLFICIICSLLFEFVEFPHSRFIQELLIGSACSFVVVVISTWAQYKVELKHIISDYISATANLIGTLATYADFQISISDVITEKVYFKLKAEFDKYYSVEQEIACITKKGTEKEINKNQEIKEIYLNFAKNSFDSPKAAVRAATDKDSIMRAIDNFLNIWPNCYQKDYIATAKSWLVEENDKEEGR